MADERDPDFQRTLRDRTVSRQYRDLEPLEPPPELDRKILDAARLTPAGRHRWYYGLAAAAVLVFAVALTLHIERERPDPEAAVPGAPLRLDRELRGQIKPAAPPAAKPEPKAETPPPAVAFTPDPQPAQAGAAAEASSNAAPAPEQARAAPVRPARGDALRLSRDRSAGERTAAVSEARQAEALSAEARAGAERAAQRSAAAPIAAAAPAAVPEKPEPWLERIAELRSRGRHADADRELAAFRKVYPNFQLSDLMRERVEGIPTPSR